MHTDVNTKYQHTYKQQAYKNVHDHNTSKALSYVSSHLLKFSDLYIVQIFSIVASPSQRRPARTT